MELSLKSVCLKARKANSTVIVGAGKKGAELLGYLKKDKDVSVIAFFDNNEALIGNRIEGIEVKKPYKIVEDNCVYIITVKSVEYRQELRSQLQSLGISNDCITVWCYVRDYEYHCNLAEEYYAEELQAMYYERLGKKMDWRNPITYNEKINWEKLNVRDERRTRLADKYLVRGWIKEQIGEKYLTKLLGAWDNAEDIDFDSLPEAFVLKLNNGSSRNIVVKDKSKIDPAEICQKLNEWKNHNFAYINYEMHYRDITPKIICEEYLDGLADSVYDYNIFCFHGEPEYIWCIKNSHRPECKASFYTKDWEMQQFSYGYPLDPVPAPKPEKLDEMLEISRILSKDFPHVRVDMYDLPGGRVLFGEMTFSTWGGFERWEPEEYDTIFGKMI